MAARPVGWRNEPARHALAAKGFATPLFSREGTASTRAFGPPKSLRYGGELRGATKDRYEWGYKDSWHASYILRKMPLPDSFWEDAGLPKQELWELAHYMPSMGGGIYMSGGQWWFLSKEDAFHNLRHDLNSNYEIYNTRDMKSGTREIPIEQIERYFGILRPYLEKHPEVKEKFRQIDEQDEPPQEK